MRCEVLCFTFGGRFDSALTTLFNDLPTTKPARKHFTEVIEKARVGAYADRQQKIACESVGASFGIVACPRRVQLALRTAEGTLTAIFHPMAPVHGSFPCMLIHYEAGRRKWFITSGSEIHRSLFPPDKPRSHSLAASLLANTFENKKSGDVRTDHWFDRDSAEKYYIQESCFKTGPDSVTVIPWWEDEQQLIDIEQEDERRASRRSDYRDEY